MRAVLFALVWFAVGLGITEVVAVALQAAQARPGTTDTSAQSASMRSAP